MEQLWTVANDGTLAMCEVKKGIVHVDSISMFRHAGDHDDGLNDSWFIRVKGTLVSSSNHKCEASFTHRTTLQHGMSKEVCAAFGGSILLKGEIDLKHWAWDAY